MNTKPEQAEGDTPQKSTPDGAQPNALGQTLVRMVIFAGFFLQVVYAFFIFVVLHKLQLFAFYGGNFQLMFELLFSMLPAVSFGFLTANFIFHKLPVVGEKLAEVNDYKETQLLLLKVLLYSLLFAVVAGFLVLFLPRFL